MTLHKPLKIVLGVLVVFGTAVGFMSIDHPIILKWVTGSARHHGMAIPATVYANGHATDRIKIFYSDKENNYLLSLAEYDSSEMLKFINIDLNERSITRPVATSKNDYDLIAGHLFQSKSAEHFTSFQDMNFDPQVTFTAGQVKFNMPTNKLKLDSVRIILPFVFQSIE